MREAPKWYNHYTLQNLPQPPTLAEQQDWVSTAEYKLLSKRVFGNHNFKPVSIDDLKSIGSNTLTKLAAKESSHKSNQMTTAWTTKMLHGGTIADKISALSLQIKYQQLTIPLYIDSLLSLANRKGNKDTNLALETLRDLFITDILPLNRKLRFFHEQPWVVSYTSYTKTPTRSTIPPLHPYRNEPKADLLALFYLEDAIKRFYGRYIEILSDQLQTSNLLYVKNHRVKLVFELIGKIPEQEQTLLVLIINKFGDGNRGIVSRVQFCLDKLVKSTPSLKLSIVKEIERIIFRPHIKQRTQYFAILFISNLLLDKNDLSLAQYLLTMYLTLFQVIINDALPLINDRQLATQAFIEKNKAFLQNSAKGRKASIAKKKMKQLTKHTSGGMSTKILGALLNGVARCLPYAIPSETQGLPEHKKTEEQRAIETVLVSQIDQLIHCAASTAQTNGNVCVQSLALIWQILSVVKAPQDYGKGSTISDKNTPKLSRDPFYRCLYSVIQFPQIYTCSRVKIFLNVLFKAIKNDHSKTRVLAMVKRLLQCAMNVNVQSMASVMYIISNVAETHQFIYNAVQRRDKAEEIIKQDIMTSTQYNLYLQTIAREKKEENTTGKVTKSSYDFELRNAEKIVVNGVDCWKIEKVRSQSYDPFEGDPLYSRAESTGLYELCTAMSHYHPTLQVWANKFFQGELIQYSGDPLKDFSPISFLDNWLRKQSKKSDVTSANVHQAKRLIIDPEIEEYMKESSNAFITNFIPLYKNRPDALKRTKILHEDEEEFADRLVEEELLRLGGRGQMDQFDYEDFGDFDDEIGDGEGEYGGWSDSIAFLGGGNNGEGEDYSHFDGFDSLHGFGMDGDMDEDMDEDDYDDEDDDFDESTLVSLDWDSLDPSKATMDEISDVDDDQEEEEEEEEIKPKLTKKQQELANKLLQKNNAQNVAQKIDPKKDVAKFTAAGVFDGPVAKNNTKKTKSDDLFDDLDLSDLENDDDDDDGGSDDDDDDDNGSDGDNDLRGILDDDDAIVELLETSNSTSTKQDKHLDKMSSVGLGGKQSGGSAAKKRKEAPTGNGKDKGTKKPRRK
jgi:ribosome biogenesis protein MAK21